MLDQGVVRVPSKSKADSIRRLLKIIDCPSDRLICVGDSDMDLSMIVDDCTFIGFNPSREGTFTAFAEAGVTVVESKNLDELRPHLGL
jgi:phosphoserine phosphatase